MSFFESPGTFLWRIVLELHLHTHTACIEVQANCIDLSALGVLDQKHVSSSWSP